MNARSQPEQPVIIGAGLGGLAAALSLAAAGRPPLVFDALDAPGGKVGTATVDGVSFDTGPSVLTMPDTFAQLFAKAGRRMEDELTLVGHDPAFRYLWPDGTTFDVTTTRASTLASAARVFGDDAARDLERFLNYAQRIWEAAAPNFVMGEAPSVGRLLRMPVGQLARVRHIDSLRSMQRGIEAHVAHPRLRDVLMRYATYNGSDPRTAPATLNCIAHVELAGGGWGIAGGVAELARALERVATQAGASFHYGRRVTKVVLDAEGRVEGICLDDGQVVRTRAVIANADAAHVQRDLLPRASSPGFDALRTPSMSGWTAVLRARRRTERAPHAVLFPTRYAGEFEDIFDHGRPPEDPTVYVCAQEKAQRRTGWAEHEPLFVMANAPAEPDDGASDPACWSTLRDTVLRRLREHDLIDADDEVVWERTPTDLARAFPGSRGAIYGLSSNDRMAAFQRPPNRTRISGLYLASGSAHPGGGMPLCAQSGRLAADALLADTLLAETRGTRR